MTGGEIPIVAPGDITPDWFARVLRKAGHEGVVESLSARRTGDW
jgi:hypothetical protein